MRIYRDCFLYAASVISAAVFCAATRAADATNADSLSDALSDRIVSAEQGWGELGLNAAARSGNNPAMKLRIKDKEYSRGLGHHANGEIVVYLGGEFKTFQTEVGLQWLGGTTPASVVFQIYVDDKKVFESGIVRENDPPRPVSVSVEGAELLRLAVNDAGDGIHSDLADWAYARLIRNPAAPKKPLEAAVDVAPFARVLAWNPKDMTGTKANRVQEMPAEDVFPAKELLPADGRTYPVPLENETGCIGLQWAENRFLRRLAIQFPDATGVPPSASVELQYWTGESAWQGIWLPVGISSEKIENALVWTLPLDKISQKTQKVRWVFSAAKQPIILKGLSAFGQPLWKTVDVRIESTHPESAKQAEIEIYNGMLLDPKAISAYRCTWDTSKPLSLKVRSSVPRQYKADRTVLRFQFPETAFGVAIEDLLANDCVYVPHADVFVAREPSPVTLDEYLKKISARKTVLEQVRQKPDQDFSRAWAAIHNPVQDLGPMMLSLACDNRKYVVEREGTVIFDEYDRPDDPRRVVDGPLSVPRQWRLVPHFGVGKDLPITRHLQGGWLPMPVTTAKEGPVVYEQTTYVVPENKAPVGKSVWLRDRALCVAEYAVKNEGSEASAARLSLNLGRGENNKQPLQFKQVKEGLLIVTGDRVLGLIDIRQASPLVVKLEAEGVVLAGILPGGKSVRCVVSLPAWKVSPEEYSSLAKRSPWAAQAEAYWKNLLKPAMQIEIPDAFLNDIIRASQVHCLLAARNEDNGEKVSPWISADRYGPLESEANAVIRGMDMTGHADFARRSLEYLFGKCSPAGFITTGYTLVGTGECLWTLGEHYQRTRDRTWLRKMAPEVVRICQWIIRQRAKTKRLDANGQKAPEYGLMPPGVTADWNRFAYRFYNDAQYCAGLEAAARALAEIGDPAAPAIREEARQYREDIVRAFHWTQARTPVVRLDNGTWVPADPAFLDCFGRLEDFLPGEDGNRSWAYSVDLGAHHLAANRVLDPASKDVDWMADYLEDIQFLRTGMADYPEENNRKDVFSFGGFAKLQPYYCRFAEVHALRDDVKPFVRSYFNAIPTLVSRENLSFWEHFHNIGGWNKTHETGWFLCQTRLMMVAERGDELWLAPFVTNHWLEDGMKVAVRNAPTRFGKASYSIDSAAAKGRIEASVQLPPKISARKIVLRLRHPEGKPIQSVTVQGKPHTDFDPKKETITIVPADETITVRAQY